MIRERLLALPEEIEKGKIKVMEKQNELNIARDLIKHWEMYELVDITDAVDASGKPKHSNDVKRNAELQSRKKDSAKYPILIQQERSLTEELALTTIALDRLINEQNNLRAICRLGDE